MHKMDRPGIDPNWERGWGLVRKQLLQIVDINLERNEKELEHYAAHGTALTPGLPSPSVTPPLYTWETVARSPLATFSYIRMAEAEIAGMEGNPDRQKMVDAFVANCAHQITSIHLHEWAPVRFPGRALQTLNYLAIPFLALGVVLGCKEQSFRLARLQLLACRRKFYLDNRHYPIYQFILRLLADYLEEPPHILASEILAEPIFTSLFDVWRDPHPENLLPLCLAACDFHTTRNKSSDRSNFYEFAQDMWTRFPGEILLLFRLREYLGLPNPTVDHPLMNTSLGRLPAAGGCETTDPVLLRTLARMRAECYDEVRIFDEVMAVKRG